MKWEYFSKAPALQPSQYLQWQMDYVENLTIPGYLKWHPFICCFCFLVELIKAVPTDLHLDIEKIQPQHAATRKNSSYNANKGNKTHLTIAW